MRWMSHPPFQVEQLAIVGVGLIGGSIAAAARSRQLAKRILGYGRNPSRLEAACKLGVIDDFGTEPSALKNADLVVICTPVDQIARDVQMALGAIPETALVTDAGSVKGAIVDSVFQNAPRSVQYVPAHPLAGSHLTGFEHSTPTLYVNRMCVITPTSQNRKEDVAAIHQFWRGLGMRTCEMSAEEHDQILALTSHLPHLAAAVVASMVEEPMLEFAAGGYRDTTRVAAGDPGLWTAIFRENRSQMIEAIDRMMRSMGEFRNALATDDTAAMKEFLSSAQRKRERYRDQGQSGE